jgi:hypothetical protein
MPFNNAPVTYESGVGLMANGVPIDDLGGSGTGGLTVALPGTSLTINAANASTYNGNVIVSGSASATSVVLAAGLPAGFNVGIEQGAAGTVTLTGSGTTINGPSGATSVSTAGRGTLIAALQNGTDFYDVQGVPTGPAINTQTGGSYTLVLADVGNQVDMNNAGANTVVIPDDASVPGIPIGATVTVRQKGAGATTISGTGAGGQATAQKPTARSLTISAQLERALLQKVAANTWDVLAS